MRTDTIFRVANLVLLLVNVGMFILWWSMIRRDALPATSDAAAAYVLNQVSVQVTTLGVMMAFGALLIAGLGVFGFQTILERSEAKADQAARDVVSRLVDEHRKNPMSNLNNIAPMQLPDAGTVTEAQD